MGHASAGSSAGGSRYELSDASVGRWERASYSNNGDPFRRQDRFRSRLQWAIRELPLRLCKDGERDNQRDGEAKQGP